MKTSYFVLFVFFLSSCTSTKYVTTERVGEIIEASGTKNDLYIRANEWMVRTFTSAKSVIQFQDKEAGKIMGKYLIKSISLDNKVHKESKPIDIYALITISIKDNATRIDIEPQGDWPYNKRFSPYSPENAQSDIIAVIDDYKKFISLKEDVWQKFEPTNPKSNMAPSDLKKKTNKNKDVKTKKSGLIFSL